MRDMQDDVAVRFPVTRKTLLMKWFIEYKAVFSLVSADGGTLSRILS